MKGNKSNRLLINMGSYAILQMVNLLVGLFLPRLYLAAYGSEINGIVSTVNSFTSYFSYLEAGLGLTLIHSLFKPLADDDTNRINGVLNFSKKQYQKISFIYFILVIILSVVFPFARSTNDIGRIEFISLVFVIGIYGALDFFTMAKYRVLLTADRKEYVISNATIVAQILRFVFVWMFISFDMSVVFVKIVPILTLLVRSLILKIYVKYKYPEITFNSKTEGVTVNTWNRWDALLLQISISTSVSLPAIVVSQIMGYKEANVYAVYSLVISAVISVISALSSGVSPMLGRSIAKGENISGTYRMYDTIVSFVITVIFSVTAIMIIPFVRLYTNVVEDINYIDPMCAILITVWAAIYTYRIPFTAVINAAALYKENRINNIVNLSTQIVGGILMTIWLGIPGLLVVMIVSALQRNVWFSFVVNRALIKNAIVKSGIKQAVMTIMIVASFFIGSAVVRSEQMDAFSWICTASIVTAIQFVVCLIVYSLLDIKAFKQIVDVFKKKALSKKI